LLHEVHSVSSFCVKITDFCNKLVQAAKNGWRRLDEKPARLQKNKRLAVAYRPNRRFMAAYGGCWEPRVYATYKFKFNFHADKV